MASSLPRVTHLGGSRASTRLGPPNTISLSTHLAFLHLCWGKAILATLNHPALLVLFSGLQWETPIVLRKSDHDSVGTSATFLSIFQTLNPLPP